MTGAPGAGYDPEDLRVVVTKIALEATGLLRDYACTEEASRIVRGDTAYIDKLSEDYIIDSLKREGLRAVIVSEESGVAGEGDLVVLIDPLDGSKNYLACIPWASVSIAVAPRGSSLRGVIAGVVAPVFFGEPLSFAKGRGCYYGGARIEPGESKPANILAVYIEEPEVAVRLARVIRGLGGVKVRSLGSSALEISYAVTGRFLGFVDLRSRLRNIDVAASLGLAEECGGLVVDSKGRRLDSGILDIERVGEVIASSRSHVVESILESIK